MRYVLGNVFRPAFSGIEGDDANRVAILAGEQILNDRLEITGPGAGRRRAGLRSALRGEEDKEIRERREEGRQEGRQQSQAGRASARTLGSAS